MANPNVRARGVACFGDSPPNERSGILDWTSYLPFDRPVILLKMYSDSAQVGGPVSFDHRTQSGKVAFLRSGPGKRVPNALIQRGRLGARRCWNTKESGVAASPTAFARYDPANSKSQAFTVFALSAMDMARKHRLGARDQRCTCQWAWGRGGCPICRHPSVSVASQRWYPEIQT